MSFLQAAATLPLPDLPYFIAAPTKAWRERSATYSRPCMLFGLQSLVIGCLHTPYITWQPVLLFLHFPIPFTSSPLFHSLSFTSPSGSPPKSKVSCWPFPQNKASGGIVASCRVISRSTPSFQLWKSISSPLHSNQAHPFPFATKKQVQCSAAACTQWPPNLLLSKVYMCRWALSSYCDTSLLF